jgi:hypothetical protein
MLFTGKHAPVHAAVGVQYLTIFLVHELALLSLVLVLPALAVLATALDHLQRQVTMFSPSLHGGDTISLHRNAAERNAPLSLVFRHPTMPLARPFCLEGNTRAEAVLDHFKQVLLFC